VRSLLSLIRAPAPAHSAWKRFITVGRAPGTRGPAAESWAGPARARARAGSAGNLSAGTTPLAPLRKHHRAGTTPLAPLRKHHRAGTTPLAPLRKHPPGWHHSAGTTPQAPPGWHHSAGTNSASTTGLAPLRWHHSAGTTGREERCCSSGDFGSFYHTVGQGTFHCRKCGGDRQYRHRAGRRFFTLFFIPVIPLNRTGEHVQCTTCKTRYVTDVLSLPTAAQMQAALPAGMRAAATAMLVAVTGAARLPGSGPSPPSRGPAPRTTPMHTWTRTRPSQPRRIRAALSQVARQLTPDAKEWFLAEIVRIGMADGLLTDSERRVAEMIAMDLGMTQAQAVGVVTMAERSAQPELSPGARQLPGSPGEPLMSSLAATYRPMSALGCSMGAR